MYHYIHTYISIRYGKVVWVVELRHNSETLLCIIDFKKLLNMTFTFSMLTFSSEILTNYAVCSFVQKNQNYVNTHK